MVIYYYQNYESVINMALAEATKTVESTYTINDAMDVKNKKQYIIDNFKYLYFVYCRMAWIGNT